MTQALAVVMLNDALRECSKHIQYMCEAMRALAALRPLTAARYTALGAVEIKELDQFILRFTKLQDAVGVRLMPAILRALQEPFEDKSMLDRLNTLEKLGFIEDSAAWQAIRESRNKLTHEYPDEPAKNVANLELAFAAAAQLEGIVERIFIKLRAMQLPVTW